MPTSTSLMTLDSTVFSTGDDVAQAALEKIIELSKKSISEHGSFSIVMAGGSTPEKVYRLLSQCESDWNKWQFYIGDERCLEVDDADRNSLSARKNLLDHIDVPEENIHFMPAELGAEEGSKAYAEVIAGLNLFDLVMLGIGEDGHTASLFPGHIHNSDELVHAVYDSPKPPSNRISMSANLLSQNHYLMILVTGENKQTAVKEWLEGVDLPIAHIGTLGEKSVLLDEAAAGTLFD